MNILITPAHAGKFSYICGIAAKMAQASGSMVNVDVGNLVASPTSDQFRAVIDEINIDNINFD